MATYQHGYDRRTAFQLLKQGGPFWWKFSHWARPFDDQKIRAMLAALSTEVRKRSTGSFSAAALFMILRMADVPDSQLQSTWRDTMAALDGLNAYEFGARKKKHEKLRSIAKDRRQLSAWQAAAVGSEWIPTNLLALLLCDGSEESLDALMPHVERARNDRDRLEQLEAARVFAAPSTARLFAVTDQKLTALRSASSVLALGRELGLEKNGRVRVRVLIPATEAVRRGGTTQQYFAELEFDSDANPDLQACVSHRTTSPTSYSEWSRAIPCKDLSKLPRALERAGTKLGVQWFFNDAKTTFLSKKLCGPLLDWLGRADRS